MCNVDCVIGKVFSCTFQICLECTYFCMNMHMQVVGYFSRIVFPLGEPYLILVRIVYIFITQITKRFVNILFVKGVQEVRCSLSS